MTRLGSRVAFLHHSDTNIPDDRNTFMGIYSLTMRPGLCPDLAIRGQGDKFPASVFSAMSSYEGVRYMVMRGKPSFASGNGSAMN